MGVKRGTLLSRNRPTAVILHLKCLQMVAFHFNRLNKDNLFMCVAT